MLKTAGDTWFRTSRIGAMGPNGANQHCTGQLPDGWCRWKQETLTYTIATTQWHVYKWICVSIVICWDPNPHYEFYLCLHAGNQISSSGWLLGNATSSIIQVSGRLIPCHSQPSELRHRRHRLLLHNWIDFHGVSIVMGVPRVIIFFLMRFSMK